MKFFGNTFLILALLALCGQPAVMAQQKTADDPVPELAAQRFEFKEGAHTFVIPCDSNLDINKSSDDVQHAFLMVPGFLRQRHYHDVIVDSLKSVDALENVVVVSPQFLNKADVEFYQLGKDYPFWSNGGWAIGNNSIHDGTDPAAAKVSSFTVMDRLLEDVVRRFPKLKTLTVVGFSAGGQYLNRYAAGNRVNDWVEARSIAVTYVVAAPSSYLYFNAERALSTNPLVFGSIDKTPYAGCKDFNSYRYGLLNLNEYMRGASADRIPSFYAQRRVVHLVGEKDDASASAHLASSCPAMAQGEHRVQRAIIYFGYLQHLFGEQVKERHSLVIVPGVGHNSRGLFVSKDGSQVLVDSMKHRVKARD